MNFLVTGVPEAQLFFVTDLLSVLEQRGNTSIENAAIFFQNWQGFLFDNGDKKTRIFS